jgi:hypothetical protein
MNPNPPSKVYVGIIQTIPKKSPNGGFIHRLSLDTTGEIFEFVYSSAVPPNTRVTVFYNEVETIVEIEK